MPSLTVERCVKAIHLLASEGADGVPVGSGELARALNTSAKMVINMFKSLSRSELVIYTRYEGVRLTSSGRHLALKVLRRQRLLELFLARSLGLPWDVVRAEAEGLEHAVSDRIIEQIDACLGHPDVDPHGDPIPKPDGSALEGRGSPLRRLPGGRHFRVVRVVDRDSTLLRYLTECGVGLGTTGEVAENRPEAGVIVLRVGGRTVALGRGAADDIFVDSKHRDDDVGRPRSREAQPEAMHR